MRLYQALFLRVHFFVCTYHFNKKFKIKCLKGVLQFSTIRVYPQHFPQGLPPNCPSQAFLCPVLACVLVQAVITPASTAVTVACLLPPVQTRASFSGYNHFDTTQVSLT